MRKPPATGVANGFLVNRAGGTPREGEMRSLVMSVKVTDQGGGKLRAIALGLVPIFAGPRAQVAFFLRQTPA
jgi:hypothetical protein